MVTPKCIAMRKKAKTKRTILVVCSQNRLRSVLAWQALRAKRPDLAIQSGGIPKDGRKFRRKADKRAREAVQSQYGVDLSDYRSQAVTEDMIERAIRIFVLSRHNRKELIKLFPAAEGKIELFCHRSVSDWNVNPVEIFEQDILPAVERWAPLLSKRVFEESHLDAKRFSRSRVAAKSNTSSEV